MSAGERPHTHALDRAATATGEFSLLGDIFNQYSLSIVHLSHTQLTSFHYTGWSV
jgi:hypothetical protein